MEVSGERYYAVYSLSSESPQAFWNLLNVSSSQLQDFISNVGSIHVLQRLRFNLPTIWWLALIGRSLTGTGQGVMMTSLDGAEHSFTAKPEVVSLYTLTYRPKQQAPRGRLQLMGQQNRQRLGG